MPRRWVENTSTGPRIIGGELCQPGEGAWVDDGPYAQPTQFPPVRQNPVTRELIGADDQPIQGPVSGAGIDVSTSRAITAADDGLSLKATASLTLTIPAGLSPMPSFSVDCPPSGTVTVVVSGGATLNGGTASLTRTRAANPVGFVVLAHEAEAYGMSGS